MIVILNTRTDDRAALRLHALLSERDQETVTFHTAEMKIAHCMGCNHCFLKTPGICAIKDDYEQILGQLAHTDQLWLVADTHFRFIDAKGKRVMDRLLPLLNMGLEFRQGSIVWTKRKLPDPGGQEVCRSGEVPVVGARDHPDGLLVLLQETLRPDLGPMGLHSPAG